jgi:Zn-dependent M28 family amino/carboxypeptidase
MTDRPTTASRRGRVTTIVVLAAALAVLVSAPGASGAHPLFCKLRANNTYDKLLDCVTLQGVRKHQAELQAIAEENDDIFYPGTRAAGTEGYEDSVAYVAEQLRDAGWKVTLDPFEFEFEFPSLVQQLTPTATTHPSAGFTGTGYADVTAAVTPVDINLVPPRANTSGCDGAYTETAVGEPLTSDPGGPDDFAGFPDGNIALLQRGGCSFALKAANAEEAGASAVIVFNQGNTPGRSVTFAGNAVPPDGSAVTTISIPVVGVSTAAGQALAQPGTTARVRTITPETRTDHNVIAELPGRNANNVVMAGAHLDSVTEGPGINDNGSGSAALLETAIQMARVKPQNTLRFAWWGAEELGLIGSAAYVEELSAAELDRIALYMNYDMIGSPNYIFMVYDADQSTFPAPEGVPIPAGSEAVEDVYEIFYTWKGEPYDDTEFSGRSDYEAFILNGIPASGIFTGAEEIKTPEQQAIWGGVAGQQFDPCYHLACDTYANNNDHALDVNSDAVAFAALTFAYSTQSVNGVPGQPVPGSPTFPAPRGPEGTFRP